jgi:hypothetical protein
LSAKRLAPAARPNARLRCIGARTLEAVRSSSVLANIKLVLQ